MKKEAAENCGSIVIAWFNLKESLKISYVSLIQRG